MGGGNRRRRPSPFPKTTISKTPFFRNIFELISQAVK
jgi:hypothetical protein